MVFFVKRCFNSLFFFCKNVFSFWINLICHFPYDSASTAFHFVLVWFGQSLDLEPKFGISLNFETFESTFHISRASFPQNRPEAARNPPSSIGSIDRKQDRSISSLNLRLLQFGLKTVGQLTIRARNQSMSSSRWELSYCQVDKLN